MALHVDIFETPPLRGENWLCACTKPGREAVTAANCELADYEAYYPRTEVRRAGELRRIALFSGYLFVRGCQNYARIRAIEGVDAIIAQDDEPIPVRPAIIADLRSRELDGIIPTERIPHTPALFAPGVAVRLTSGAQAGLMGTVERMLGRRRAAVVVRGLGRTMQVSVPIEGLAIQPVC